MPNKMKTKQLTKPLTKLQKQVVSTIALHIVVVDIVALFKENGANDADIIMTNITESLTPQQLHIMECLKLEVSATKKHFLTDMGLNE